MQFLYTVEFEDGSKEIIVSDIEGMYRAVNRIQIVCGKRINSISNSGKIKIINEHVDNRMETLKAEIKHHVKRIEESVGIYDNGRNKDILKETDAIRELCR